MSAGNLEVTHAELTLLTSQDPDGRTPLADLLGRAAMDLNVQPDLDATMQAVVRQAVEIVDGVAAGAALFSSRRCRLDVSAATTERIDEVDKLQFDAGNGPSFAALRQAGPVTVRDTRDERRWPTWASAAHQLGFRSMVAMPLDLAPYHWAVMSIYWSRPDLPDGERAAAVALFAPLAAVAITNARQSSTLREAIQARHRIGLAQGILMERLGLDARQSFAVLRRYSRENNIKLNRIAQHVVETGSLSVPRENTGDGCPPPPARVERRSALRDSEV